MADYGKLSSAKLFVRGDTLVSTPASSELFMLWWDGQERSLQLVEFDRERAIASLKSGEPVIPLWLDRIHQRVASKLVS